MSQVGMASAPHWAQLIRYLYITDSGVVKAPILDRSSKKINEDHPFITDIELEQSEVVEGLSYVSENGLVELVSEVDGLIVESEDMNLGMFAIGSPFRKGRIETSAIRLSTKGFGVAYERERRERQVEWQSTQNRINTLVGAFTVVLGVGVGIQAIIMLSEASRTAQGLSLFLAAFALLVVVLYQLSKEPQKPLIAVRYLKNLV